MFKVLVLKKRTTVLLIALVLLLSQAGLYTLKQTVPSLYRTPGTFYMLKTDARLVALTFDDGPSPIYTPQILAILKKHNVRATFFVLGQSAEKYPELLARIKKEGHEIGNHGFSHDYTQSRLINDLLKTDQAIFSTAGVHTFFYRPPAGKISKQQLALLKQNNHTVALWSVDSHDWANPGSTQIVRNVTKKVFPGSIILLHDGGDSHRGQTVVALEQIIQQLKAMDYNFVSVGELKSLESQTK